MPAGKRNISASDLYRIVLVEEPRISPDGRYVAWVRQQAQEFSNDYRREIWLSPTSGGAAIQLTRGGTESQPRWSPDGQTLAFVSARDASAQLYLLPLGAPGGEARQLTKQLRGVSQPVWSPDGRHIAFLASVNAEERARKDRGDRPPNRWTSWPHDIRKNARRRKRPCSMIRASSIPFPTAKAPPTGMVDTHRSTLSRRRNPLAKRLCHAASLTQQATTARLPGRLTATVCSASAARTRIGRNRGAGPVCIASTWPQAQNNA